MKTASRTQVSLLITLLLLIVSLATVIICVRMTVSEVHHFQQQHTLATHKDVRAIRPWMTLSYISRFYHVPEPYLVNALHLVDTRNADRLPIQTLAQRNSRSVSQLTDAIQTAIITYHREYPKQMTPTPTALSTAHSPPLSVVQRFIAGIVDIASVRSLMTRFCWQWMPAMNRWTTDRGIVSLVRSAPI